MTGGGVSGSDMPSLPWTARRDVSPVEDTSLDALLAGNGRPADAGADLRPVADVLAALAARPAGDELTGLAAAQAEFRRHVVPPARVRHARRRRGRLASRLGAKVGAAFGVAVMGLAGAAAAAYAGVLPASWQQFAHRTVGAPAHVAAHDTGAAGSAARRPCAAYQHALAHGTASQQAAALRNLAQVAGGAAKVTGWCARASHSRHPAQQAYPSAPLARRGSPHHIRPPHHAVAPAVRPSGSPSPWPSAWPTAPPSGHGGVPPSPLPHPTPTISPSGPG